MLNSGNPGQNGKTGARGPPGPKGQKGREGQGLSGVKYIRWGRTNCSGDAQVLYSGKQFKSRRRNLEFSRRHPNYSGKMCEGVMTVRAGSCARGLQTNFRTFLTMYLTLAY